MVMLRSRQLLPTKPSSQPPTRRRRAATPEPSTPSQTREPSAARQSPPSPNTPAPQPLPPAAVPRRRSLRLCSKSVNDAAQNLTIGPRKRKSEQEGLSLRSGKKVVTRAAACGTEGEAKGKGKLVEQGEGGSEEGVSVIFGKSEGDQSNSECGSWSERRTQRSYTREEKGKGKLLHEDDDDDNDDNDDGENDKEENASDNVSRMERFREIARREAARFAVVTQQQEDREAVVPAEKPKVEDWPGPFSTAMKIISDRENKLKLHQGSPASEKGQSLPITWIPKKNLGRDRARSILVPSLQELCLRILAKNADAISSLDGVPDALRHRLCKMLCDSRRMNGYFLELLVRGSPTEIRVRDCSWLSEEEFVKCFGGCDTSNLTVLQLDQCGRCVADYLLPATLAQSSSGLPVLTTLSLGGACRLSDVGLSSLVSSAPALRSINLSQCSLLTHCSIDTLADSLGSILQELYINDCQSIDAMLILPALKKLEHLQVLSLAGIQTVCDDFMREFIIARGHNIKELVLTDCVKLTDSSLKVIAEACSGLCSLDLVNLRKLTDLTLGYLANGCREIQTLKLCRNAFSDEAIAAFVETLGEQLKELSLNNIKKIGSNTALSLARCSRKLQSLDLSWCRNLTDDAVGLIVDSCLSLRVLKLFGCGQVTNIFLDGHSNSELQIIGLKMSPVLEEVMVTDAQEFTPVRYSSMFPSG